MNSTLGGSSCWGEGQLALLGGKGFRFWHGKCVQKYLSDLAWYVCVCKKYKGSGTIKKAKHRTGWGLF